MTSAETAHSAAGQALGYLHQCMWALVEFGRRANKQPAVQLRLERLDDIDFTGSKDPRELLQVKHHQSKSQLTMFSPDFWRSLNVWMDVPEATDAVKVLVTTQYLDADNPLRGLRADSGRDVAGTLERVIEAAEASQNNTTALIRNRFLGWSAQQRERLLATVIIQDATPHATDLDDELVQTFRYGVPYGKETAFTQLLRGWWSKVATQLLAGTLETIEGTDLITGVSDISDQLKLDNLPVDFALFEELDRSIAEDYADRPFVQQLAWIALDNERLWTAIRDYHRSFTQRSWWLRHQLLAEEELDRFAFHLHDEWEQVFLIHVAAMRENERADLHIVGQEILTSLSQASRARLRTRFDEPWFSRGTLHAMADGEFGRRVGWHPDFAAKLEELLSIV